MSQTSKKAAANNADITMYKEGVERRENPKRHGRKKK